MKQKIKRENMIVIKELSAQFIDRYKETGDEQFFYYYNGLQGTLEDVLGQDYFRPYYKPIRRKDFIFSPKFRSLDKLMSNGFTETEDYYFRYIKLYDSIEINIKIPKDFEFKNDMSDVDVYDYIIVMDEDFCQAYTPFYALYDQEVTDFPVLQLVIREYNKKMLGMGGIFKEVRKGEDE